MVTAQKKAYSKAYNLSHKAEISANKRAYYLANLSVTNLQPLWAIDNMKKGAKI